MSLLSPLALLWLLLAIPAIVVLYLLKLKRRDRPVSSVLLWSRLIRDVQANTPFQKLRRNLLLILQVLLALLLGAALARPFVRVRALGGRNVALVVDASASMQARDVPGGRFEEARRLARRMVEGMGRGDAAVVILAGARARALCSFTEDRNALRRAVGSMRPTDAAGNLRDALLLAASLLGRRRDAEVFVLTDGAFDSVDLEGGLPGTRTGGEQAPLAARLRFVRIARRGENVGITALDARKSLSGEYDYQVYAQVRNFASKPRRFTLELYREDALVDAREVSLAPGEAHGEAFGIRGGSAGGVVRVRLDQEGDDLASDDAAAIMLQPRRQVRVLLATQGDVFLEKALNADPRVDLAKTSPSAAATAAPRYDVVVLDGKAPTGLPSRGRYLFINTGGDVAPVEVTGEVEHPTFLDWDRRHPVTRFLDLSSVQIARARTARVRSWGLALAESASGPLLVAGEKEGLRSLFLAFDPMQSDLPLKVAFPILLSNALDWLMGSGLGTAAVRARAGDVVATELPEDVRRVEVTLPGGARRSLPVEQSPFLFAETDQAGIYRLEAKQDGQPLVTRFAVNVLSEEESDTRPRPRIRVGSTSVSMADPGSQRVPREIWRWVALAAVCLLAFEWYAYHRRL